MKTLKVEKDTRLTEEVIEEYDFATSNPFRISFSNKKCKNKNNETNHFIANTEVCWNCYYNELMSIMKRKIKKSKRKDFLIYQMRLRKYPEQFLRELNDIILDNQEFLDENDYSTSSDYEGHIVDLKNNLKSNLNKKINAVLKYLYERRETGSNYDLGTILKDLGFLSSKQEVYNISELLERKELAKVATHSDGSAVRINANGIQYFEEDSENSQGESSNILLEDLIHHLDLKFAELTLELNLNAKELADLVEELHEKFDKFTKPSISRMVKMKLGEYFMSVAVKDGLMQPTLKQIAESIENIDF